MRRNALDVCLSCYKKDFTFAYAHDLRACGGAYRAFASLMRRWRLLLGDSLLVVKRAPPWQSSDHRGLSTVSPTA